MRLINDDREIVDLRMQSEDLINNIDNIAEELFKAEADRIDREMNARMAILIEQYK